MELGNMVFGNSRGEVSITRHAGFEGLLLRLFAEAELDESYGEDFENEVFSVFPYYWGDCDCGWEQTCGELEKDWHDVHKHLPTCYQTEYQAIREKYDWLKEEKKHDKAVRELCKKHGVSYPFGSAVHCTCPYEKEWESFCERTIKKIGEHPETCPTMRPNFHHKPSGYKIKWYKYPLRDSYANKELNIKEFGKIIDDCIKSLNP